MKAAYAVYLAVMALVVAWIVATPLLAMSGNPAASAGYEAGKYICHQKISRSYCLFSQPYFGIGDCTPQAGIYRNDIRSEICADGKGEVRENCLGLQGYGYKFPVSARDMAIYFGMFAGAASFPLFWKIGSRQVPHWIWLVIAILPLAVDGITQYLGWRESANYIRAGTGLLAGIAMSLYFIPILNRLAGGEKGMEKEADIEGWKTLAAAIAVFAFVYFAMVFLMHPGI